MKNYPTNSTRSYSRRRLQRGIALVWLCLVLVIITLCAGFSIDMSWLYFQRQHAQNATDAAALAGDWAIEKGQTNAQANTLATEVMQYNGYVNGNGPTVTLTPQSNSNPNDYTATVTTPEPMFFAFTVSSTGTKNIAASATANFSTVPPISGDTPAFFGFAGGNPIVLVAYGPDQGDTRGDAVNTRWNDVTGEYTKVPNPANYDGQTNLPVDAGETYLISPRSDYASQNPVGDSMMAVQIFDPQTSTSAWDTNTVDQFVGTGGGTVSPSQTTGEKWIYTLSSVVVSGSSSTTTQIATATYGETQTNLEATWVTPPGFIVNLANYDLTKTTFILNVKTGNPYVAGQNNALDKNGYQVRAGPNFDETSSSPSGTTTSAGIAYDTKVGLTITDPSNSSTTVTLKAPLSDSFATDSNGDVFEYPGSGLDNSQDGKTITSTEQTILNPNDSWPWQQTPPTGTPKGTVVTDTPLLDAYWNWLSVPIINSTLTPIAGMAAENNLPVTAYANGTGTLGFGYLGPNPNGGQPSIITFNGFDEDSGATGITYTVSAPGQSYDGVTFSGALGYQAKDGNGNGIWSAPGDQTRGVQDPTTKSNTVYFAPGAYKGGTWTADYATGKEDTSTWNWTVNWAGAPGESGHLRLISTTYSDY